MTDILKTMRDIEQGVIWRDDPMYAGAYQASTNGDIKSVSRIVKGRWGNFPVRERILTPTLKRDGYKRVNMSRNGVMRCEPVHRVVARCFLGECPPGQQVRHLNGNRLDNRPENLAYGTPADNEADKVAHGMRYFGERCPHTIPNAVLPKIFELARSGTPHHRIAVIIGSGRSHIGRILRGEARAHETSALRSALSGLAGRGP